MKQLKIKSTQLIFRSLFCFPFLLIAYFILYYHTSKIISFKEKEIKETLPFFVDYKKIKLTPLFKLSIKNVILSNQNFSLKASHLLLTPSLLLIFKKRSFPIKTIKFHQGNITLDKQNQETTQFFDLQKIIPLLFKKQNDDSSIKWNHLNIKLSHFLIKSEKFTLNPKSVHLKLKKGSKEIKIFTKTILKNKTLFQIHFALNLKEKKANGKLKIKKKHISYSYKLTGDFLSEKDFILSIHPSKNKEDLISLRYQYNQNTFQFQSVLSALPINIFLNQKINQDSFLSKIEKKILTFSSNKEIFFISKTNRISLKNLIFHASIKQTLLKKKNNWNFSIENRKNGLALFKGKFQNNTLNKSISFSYLEKQKAVLSGILKIKSLQHLEGNLFFNNFIFKKNKIKGPLNFKLLSKQIKLNFNKIKIDQVALQANCLIDFQNKEFILIKGKDHQKSLYYKYLYTLKEKQHTLNIKAKRYSLNNLSFLFKNSSLKETIIDGNLHLIYKNQNANGKINLIAKNILTGNQNLNLKILINEKGFKVQNSLIAYEQFICKNINLSYKNNVNNNALLFSAKINNKSYHYTAKKLEKSKNHLILKFNEEDIKVDYSFQKKKLILAANNILEPFLKSNLSFFINYSFENFLGKGFIHLNQEEKKKIKLLFNINKKKIKFNSLVYKTPSNYLSGSGKAYIGKNFIYSLNLKKKKSEGFIKLSGKVLGLRSESTLIVKNINLSEWFPKKNYYVNGKIRANVQLRGSLLNPNLTIKCYIKDYKILNQKYDVYASLYYIEKKWHLNKIDFFNINKKSIKTPTISITENNQLGLNNLKIRLQDFQLIGKMSGDFYFSYNPNNQKGFVSSSDYFINKKKIKNFYTFFQLKKNQLILNNPSKNGFIGSIFLNDDKKINLKYQYHHEEKFVTIGDYKNKNWNIEILSDSFETSYLNLFLPIFYDEKPQKKLFVFKRKDEKDKNINFYLKINIDPYGKILLNSRYLGAGKIRLYGTARPSNYYLMDLTLENNVLYIEQSVFQYDNDQISIEGNASIKNLKTVDDINISIKTEGEGGVPVKTKIANIDFDGLTKLNILINGNEKNPNIKGNIYISKSEIVFNSFLNQHNINRFISNYFLYQSDYDLKILTEEKNVNFKSVFLNFPLERKSYLNIKGNFKNSNYQISGNILGQENAGTYIYQGVDFQLKKTEIIFQEKKNSFDPTIIITGKTKKRNFENKQIVDIFITKASPFSSDHVTLYSIPSKNEDEMQILLGLKKDNSNPESSYQKLFINQASKAVVNNLVLQPIEQSIRKALNLDFLHIDSDIHRMIENPKDVFDGTNPLNANLSFGKYIGYDLLLKVKADLQFNDSINLLSNTIFGFEYNLFDYLTLEGSFPIIQSKQESIIEVNKIWQF